MVDNLQPKVLVGIASRDGAESALEFAMAEARRRGVGVHLVHALHPFLMSQDPASWAIIEGSIREAGAYMLASAARLVTERLGPDFPVSTELVLGTATSALVAGGDRAAVVVLERPASDDQGRMRALSVTNGVASRAHAPVVAVPRGWDARDSEAPVCVAVKRPELSAEVVRAAVAEAGVRHVPLRVVHVWTTGDALDNEVFNDKAARAYSDHLRQRFADALAGVLDDELVEVALVMRRGHVADVLVEESKRCALLVMGRHESSVPPVRHLGSIVRTALRESQCPVMVVDAVPALSGDVAHGVNERCPVVVGVAGTSVGDPAVRRAAREAQALGVPLRLVHVAPDFSPASPSLSRADLASAGEAILQRAVASARLAAPDLTQIQTRLLHGPRMRGLIEAGAGAGLLMVGRDRSAFERFLAGRTAAVLAERAQCPVEVVSPFWEDSPGYGVVIAGLAATTDAASLLAHAFPLASAQRSRLVLLHAWQVPGGYEDIIDARVVQGEIEARMSAEVEPLLAHWRAVQPEVAVELRVVRDHTVHALADATEHADVLVLLRRPHVVPGSLHFGTIRSILHAAQCTVRVVPRLTEPTLPVRPPADGVEIPGELSRTTST